MADDVKQQEDDQNLWRAVYTAEGGWSPAVAYAHHFSVAAPVLAEADGTLYCVHRGARRGEAEQLPVVWTSFTPAAAQPFVAALEEASKPLAEGATAEQAEQRQAKIQAAAAALTEARKWTPDRHVWPRVYSAETPALVNDNGTLRMVFTQVDSWRSGATPSLWETHLTNEGGRPVWAEPTPIRGTGREYPLAPAMAEFNGAVHLLYVDPQGRSLRHLVRDAQGGWRPVGGAADSKIGQERIPSLQEMKHFRKTSGWAGNLGLAVHDGQLHLVFPHGPSGGYLLHSAFDGDKWGPVQPASPKNAEGEYDRETVQVSRRSAALASFGGKLHAVYPSAKNDKLVHLTWTKDGEWSQPVELEGHDSNNTPALLTFREGPVGEEREALLLVHRGVNRYVPPVPPAPPAPPSLADVASRGTTVTGETVSDYGPGAWSCVTHRILATPATLKNGDKALIATVDMTAEYYWGFWWYRDSGSSYSKPHMSSSTLWIRKPGDKNFARHADFAGGRFDSSGKFRTDVLITGLEPGTYEIGLSSSKSVKIGGYWWIEHHFKVKTDREYYTQIELTKSATTITV
ncbi:hypothetical protein [Streptomyces spectabilis]|uniref:Uncharacterized protein n=1 Tax=Streptomyces spectabilis TaxID=68270 RepID=A0A516RHS3_STRST|nr:hypothetical protein [Streptomyces spectabilis]QDQ15195.1 hypothetical protein FH965_35405 [Streptomyces spectabilis]